MHNGLKFLPATALAALSLAAIGTVSFGPGAPGTPVAVFFPPATGADAALMRVASAGGEILRLGSIDSVVIARSDDPGFSDHLYGRGALLVSAALGRWLCSPDRNGSR